jgi:hypothetical protein
MAGEALHGRVLTAAMPMAMPMTVPAEPVHPVAEAAIGHALASHDRTSIQAGRHLTIKSSTAVTSFHKSHRYDADGPTPHHGQDDAAGAFHVAALGADRTWIVGNI